MGKTWSELTVDDDGLLREVITQRLSVEATEQIPKTPSAKTLKVTGVHRVGRWTVAARVLAALVLLLAVTSIALTLQVRQQGEALAALTERVEAPMTAYERCEDDLRTAWVLWQHHGADINPPSCTPPRVTHEEYARAFKAVGGAEWVTVPDGQAAP